MSVTWGGGKARQGRRFGGGTRASRPAPHTPTAELKVASVAADAGKLRSSRFDQVRILVGTDGVPASPLA